ncbi:MAG: quinolinate synthase NadA [Candidatus Desulforudis sp.]|nr:quinolinate synthase NadA [Desulforudis sp.]
MEVTDELVKEVNDLRRRRKAIILSHYYQRPELQDIADFVGDSLELSRTAARTDAEVIVFCGVHFMAESAAILSPEKVVLLPDLRAGCPMADMAGADSLRSKKAELTNPFVVSYVNTTADVKAESDICCTSANAVRIIESVPRDKQILFVPDKNLGAYAARQTSRDLVLWPGFCCIHDELEPADVMDARRRHPGALVIVHPECRPEVTVLADKVASTSGMLRFVQESQAREFIVGTEEGLTYQMAKKCPGKKFHLLSSGLVCDTMKLITLSKVRDALKTLEPRITVHPGIRRRALQALEKMLAL